MSEEFVMRELDVQVTYELTLAESSRPQEPLEDGDAGWRDPTAAEAYEARLVALRGAVEAVEAVEAGASAAPATAPPAGIEPATNRLEGDCSIR
jgi:hypothetical protein